MVESNFGKWEERDEVLILICDEDGRGAPSRLLVPTRRRDF